MPSQTEIIIEKLKSGNLDDPKQLSDFLVMLSATLMTASNFEAEAEIEKNKVWLKLKNNVISNGKERSDKYIDMAVTQEPEWREWRKMRDSNDAIKETIMALKKKLSTTIF